MRNKAGFTIVELAVVSILLAIILLGLMPFVRDVRDKARQSQCMHNIEKISIGLRIYAYEHEGRLPADLSLLWTKGYVDSQDLFDCPFTAAKGSGEMPEYDFNSRTNFNTAENIPLVYDRIKNHRNGRVNVLYVNGDIVNKSAEKLKAELEDIERKEKAGFTGAMAE